MRVEGMVDTIPSTRLLSAPRTALAGFARSFSENGGNGSRRMLARPVVIAGPSIR